MLLYNLNNMEDSASKQAESNASKFRFPQNESELREMQSEAKQSKNA